MLTFDSKIQNGSGINTQREAQQFVKARLPSLYKVVKLGQKSHFFKLVEKTFHLLNDLQFCCLPLQYRNLCVKHYLSSERQKKLEEMTREHEEWLENEALYLEDAAGNLENLSQKEKELIPFIRESVLTVVYEEQEVLKSQDAFHHFLSICNPEGNKNEVYFEYVQKIEKARTEKALTVNRRKIDRFDQFTSEELAKKGVLKEKLGSKERELVDKTTAAVCEAMRKVSLEDTPTTRDYFLFDLSQTKLAGLKDARSLSLLDEARKATESFTAKEMTQERWIAFHKKEDALFEKLCGFKLERMSTRLRNFRSSLRAITYRLIYEEQLKAKIDHYLYATFPYFYDYAQLHKSSGIAEDDHNQTRKAFKRDLRDIIEKLTKNQFIEIHIEDYLLQFFKLLPTTPDESGTFFRRAKGALSSHAQNKDTLLTIFTIFLTNLEKGKKKAAAYAALAELCKKRADYTDDFPFVSICTKKGELNTDYWIDKLDARAKKNGEKPLEDNCPLKEHTDYDIIRINTAPAQALDDGKTDRTNLRKTGSLTPSFCKAVLQHVKDFSDSLYAKFTPNCESSDDEDQNLAIAQRIMQSSHVSTEEKIIFLQNHYFDALALTNNARGDTKRLLDKINIKVVTADTSLLFNSGSSDRRRSHTPDLPLRVSGDQLPRPPTPSRPVQVRKSNPDDNRGILKTSTNGSELYTPKRKSSMSIETQDQPLDATQLDKDCSMFQTELDRIRTSVKRPKPAQIDPKFEDIVAYILNYSIPLKLLGEGLNTFGRVLQYFANGLKAEEQARLQKLADEVLRLDALCSPRATAPERKGGSVRSPRRITLSGSPPSLLKGRSFSIHEHTSAPVLSEMNASGSPLKVAPIPLLRLSSSPQQPQNLPSEPMFMQDTSSQIPKMDPDKFTETSQLLLLVQRCVQDVTKLIRDDVTLATPLPEARRIPEVETDEFLL